jgi:LacI family transcriptional regulator, galactose operon repressor
MSEVKRVGVLLHPVRTYCRRVLRGITTVGAQARWEWLLVSADLNPLLDTLSHGFLHGVIGHFADRTVFGQVVRAKLPAIDIAPVDHDAERIRVTTDELAVGRLGATHLLSLGLANFAFLGNRELHHARLREQGFRESIESVGLRCHVMPDVPKGEPARGPEGQRLAEWLHQLPKPVAVMACDDSRALQILALCRNLGIEVPESVAVLGVDNDDAFCETANPSLSSIALSTQRIGYEAARMLESLMDGREPLPRQLLIPPAGVVNRRSTDLPAKLDDDVAAAVRYIALHVHEDLRVGDLLGEVPISRTSLEQKFRKVLGRTPAEEIRRAQVEVAKTMLRETDLSMSQIARAAGFSDAKQLGMTFRRETGTTPTAYRRASHS